MAKKIKLSIIIPAYNEEKLIESTLEKITKYLSKEKFSWEILVVDDGSTDNTLKLLQDLQKSISELRIVRNKVNRGKGAALREGFLKAKGDYQIYSDADLSVDIKNIDRFLEELEKYDVAIASRRVKSAEIAVAQPWYREKMGQFYTFLTQLVTGMFDIKDFTCGFKGFRKGAAKKIFSNSLIDRWAYDSEVLFLAKKYGYKIQQIPITWRNREETRVKLQSVVLESFKDLLAVRAIDFLGRYNNK